MPPTEVVAPPTVPPSTTTVSTIAVRAGENAMIVIALLKSDGYVQLRVDEMHPRLLSIGTNAEETSQLLSIHEDVIERLRSKEDQVSALLTRADALGSEKTNPDEAIVYDAMAKSLHQAWSELNKQLMLRGYLLKEALTFFRLVRHHQQLITSLSDLMRRAMSGHGGDDVTRKIEQAMDEIIETTAHAVDGGSSVIAQIRGLGQLDDNAERPQEILSSCLIIEQAMLKLVDEWEKVEQTWRANRVEVKKTEVSDEIFVQIEQWLVLSEKKVKALNETGQRRLIEEGNAHKAKLLELGAAGAAEGARVAHLVGRIEEFVHFLKTRLGRSQRIQAFFQSAQAMLSQLSMMKADMENANAAIAGELAPLARQKASGVIHEGRDISAKEVLTHEEQRLVKLKCEELETRLFELEEMAKTRRDTGTRQVSQHLVELQEWMEKTVIEFLQRNGDMGAKHEEASKFSEVHRKFAEEVVNRDASVAAAINKKSEMTSEEQQELVQFERQYERAKDALENRIQLGNAFEQVHRFAKDLESSFDALTSLLDTNRDFTNERVAAQMNNVFQMIKDTLAQEKLQGENFISSAEQINKADGYLKVDNAIQTVKNFITDHGHRLTYVTSKWIDWQEQKAQVKRFATTVEEVHMWQEEAIEIIRLLQGTAVTSQQDIQSINRRVDEFKQTMDMQKQKLDGVGHLAKTKEEVQRMELASMRQQMIEEMVRELEQKITTTTEEFAQQDVVEKIHPPQILTALKDAQVDEGSRFEFVARIEGEPEPHISWFKDGIDVKNNIDYRQDFVNGVASLVIEETFIEDTATYTVRAENAGGAVESSARLTVKSRSATSSFFEEDKPKFAQQLRNVAVTEGETARMDCVIVGRPEPEVVWYKEEQTVKEDERVRLDFAGDRCALHIAPTIVQDTGLYTARARNIHGEATSFCQLKVAAKKQPPAPPPKPISRPSSVASRPPSIQPALTNTTWEEGSTATLQVFTQGEPRPVVQWMFNGQPIVETIERHVEEKADGWSRLIISPVRSEHAGLYTVVAENEAGETSTGATLHVASTTTTTEHHLQQDMYEEINLHPVQTAVDSTKRSEFDMQEYQSVTYPESMEVSSVKSEKRWVDIIDEQLSQPSPVMSPIPADIKKKTTVTEQRWVDEIDELMGTPVIREEKEKRTAETYMRMVDELMSSTVQPIQEEATTTSQQTEFAQAIHEVPQPDVRRGTTTPSSKMFNVATVRMSPQPESYTATTTQGVITEHAAAVRRTPVPEAFQATLTSATSVENIAAIQQTPIPESHKATITPAGSVANIAAVRQSPVPMMEQASITSAAPAIGNVAQIRPASVPESQVASTVEGAKIANIARVHTPGPEPEKVKGEVGTTKIDRVDDVVLQLKPRHSDVDVKQRIDEEGFVTQQSFFQPQITTTVKTTTEEDSEAHQAKSMSQRDSLSAKTVIENVVQRAELKDAVVPQPRMIPVTTTSTTESGEGWVQEVHDEAGKPITTTVRSYKQEEELRDQKDMRTIQPKLVTTIKTVSDEDHTAQQQKISRIPMRREPMTTTMTTGEGWVKEIHEEAGKPITTTLRTYTEEDEAKRLHNILIKSVPAEPLKKTTETETTTQTAVQQKTSIPVRREPVTTTKTEGEGWVREVHEEVGKPVTTTFRQYTEEELANLKKEALLKSAQPQVTQRQTVEDQSSLQAIQQKTSKIPLRREPVSTTTTSGEGWVREIHEEAGRPVTTQYRQYTEEDEARLRSHAVTDRQPEVVRSTCTEDGYAHSETSKGQRDSFLLASDAEGFWTDGAYTGSPTPPPTLQRRQEFEKQEIGLSRTSTEPEFIRTFHNEYTVEEGGEITIECVLVGNPRPKVRVFFNEKPLRTDTEHCKLAIIHDTYMLTIKDAKLEQAGYYKITAENKRGYTESLTVVHVRPRSLGKYAPPKAKAAEHTTVSEEFAMYEYEQRRPQKHEHDASRLVTPPPAKKLQQTHTKSDEHLERYELDEKRASGHPPHFTQTLVSAVSAEGESARFEGIVTGWPAPHVEWTKDGVKLEAGELRGMQMSNIGGRVALIFESCGVEHSGKYMCTAKNSSGVATSSAQLVVRPKTIAPDFVQRLISEEVLAGQQLKWTVRVTGDPTPKVTWLRDGIVIPDCEEVRLINEGNGVHSLVIVNVETADSGQFTCLAENLAGEARSTADLVVRPEGAAPGNYFHVTKVTQEKQVRGEEPIRNSAFAIETPRQSEML